jgi:hypothetical protein
VGSGPATQLSQLVSDTPQEQPRHTSWDGVVERLPLIVFNGVFLVTCYIGTLGLLFSPRFRTTYVVFSGAQVPDLSTQDLLTALLLLHAGPLLVCIGYELMTRLVPKRRLAYADGSGTPPWLPRFVFLAIIAAAVVSLVRAEAWRGFLAWADYNSYVHARLRIFDELTFFEFVNVYTLVPLSAGYLVLTDGRRRVAAGAVAVVLALQYPLAQRKVMLISVLLIACAVYLYRHAGWAPRRRVRSRHQIAWLAGGPLLLYAAYVGLTLITVLGPGSGAFKNLTPDSERARRAHLNIPQLGDDATVSFRIDEGAIQRIQSNRVLSVSLYVLLSPLTRTSVAAVTYPVVFPRVQPYYTVDVGQDILGFGSMPDDNLLIYSVLWPEHERGAIGAPFQIALYSQGGLWLACLGSLLVGLGLALAWRWVVESARPTRLCSLYGAVIVVLSAFLAIDSIRNSLIVSYGMGWAVLALGVLGVAARLCSRINPVPAAVTR